MERWKQEVETRTGGALKINTFPGGTLLGAKDIFDGVIAGTADIGNFAMSYQPGLCGTSSPSVSGLVGSVQ